MGRKRREDRSKQSDETDAERSQRTVADVQRTAKQSNPLNAGTFSEPTIDHVPRAEQNRRRRQRNIQRAMQDTGTTQDEVPDQVLDVIGSGGMPLELPIQRSLEDRMDADFGNVRIHTGGKAAQAADAIDDKAFTCGNSIVFNSGEYDPQSAEGQHLLAHELAHVTQQNGGAPLSMKPKANADLKIDPDPKLEQEADEAAKEAMQDGPVTINRMGTDVHVQRLPEADKLDQARQQAAERFGTDSDGGVAADPEALAKEVEQLKQNQEHVMETLTEAKPGAPADGDWTEAATKGIYGSLAGAGAGAALGALGGSVLPGAGTAVGAAVGAAVSGAASDLTKEGIGVLADNAPDGTPAKLQQMYQEMSQMYKEMKERKDTGQNSLRDL
ncbi:eCIS core domain-containing protein [Halomicrobium katesii]|uniref:eCIS core domain-containing protein n=1 Tax=Halomicrobium katesii TaxID=437163 RepID=UPI000361E660|nr:DUF4157 domain-containing protein [Halomicrobium katesii]